MSGETCIFYLQLLEAQPEDPAGQGQGEPVAETSTVIYQRLDEREPQPEETRFNNVSLEETDKFLLQSLNKNTAYKTKGDVKILINFPSSLKKECHHLD